MTVLTILLMDSGWEAGLIIAVIFSFFAARYFWLFRKKSKKNKLQVEKVSPTIYSVPSNEHGPLVKEIRAADFEGFKKLCTYSRFDFKDLFQTKISHAQNLWWYKLKEISPEDLFTYLERFANAKLNLINIEVELREGLVRALEDRGCREYFLSTIKKGWQKSAINQKDLINRFKDLCRVEKFIKEIVYEKLVVDLLTTEIVLQQIQLKFLIDEYYLNSLRSFSAHKNAAEIVENFLAVLGIIRQINFPVNKQAGFQYICASLETLFTLNLQLWPENGKEEFEKAFNYFDCFVIPELVQKFPEIPWYQNTSRLTFLCYKMLEILRKPVTVVV